MYQVLFRQLHRSSTPIALCAHLMCGPGSTDKQAITAALAELHEAIRRNRCGRALSAARALLVLAGPVKAIELLKRDGALRLSSFEFNAPPIGVLVADWLDHADAYSLPSQAVTYLTSVANLCRLATPVRALYHSLLSRLRSERVTIIKCLLAEVDASFVDPGPVDVGYGENQFVTREEVAEGFSYLLGLFHAHIGLTDMQFALTTPDAGYDPRYRTLLGDALKICRYREAEVLLEAFPYHAHVLGNAVRIESDDPGLDRSIRLGYIQREVQSSVEQHRLQQARAEGEIPSLPTMADKYFERLGERVCRLAAHPVPRYVVELPIDGPLAAIFSQDGPLLEDAVGCASLAIEEYLSWGEVPHQVVHGTITVLDLYKVQRLFRFMHHGLKYAVDRHEPFSERPGLYRTSCLPVLSRERMVFALGLAVGAGKAEEALKLLTANPAAAGYDIQDAPIIAAGGYLMVSPAILASSNLPRNILSRLHQRLVPAAPGRPDPMQSQLAQALRDAGFLVAVECHLKGGKNDKLETDVLAYRDGHLFVFECKNVYHPCNVYELRNSYDAVVKAASQLSRRHSWLAEPNHQRELFTRLGWAIDDPVQVHTCVALGNRVFNGYTSEGHPVRQVHEMQNVLSRGWIEFNDGNRVRLWQAETFTATDLVAYLQGNTTHTDFASAMMPTEVETPFGGQWLILPTYALDLMQFKENVQARYPAMPTIST